MNALDLVGVDPERRSGIALDHIHAARVQHRREQRPPGALTAREALAAIAYEARFVWVCAGNLRNGIELAGEDFSRLTYAARSIDLVCAEVGV